MEVSPSPWHFQNGIFVDRMSSRSSIKNLRPKYTCKIQSQCPQMEMIKTPCPKGIGRNQQIPF
jgi:hypothetical protein